MFQYFMQVQIRSSEINNSRFTKGCYIQYKTVGDDTDKWTKTKVVKVCRDL